MKNKPFDKSRLLLLARRFPFNHGEVAAESYLESEIHCLALYFDEIIAIGTEAPHGDRPTCDLPPNVVPIALGCCNSRKDKLKHIVRGLLFPHGAGTQLEKAFASDPVKGAFKRVFRGYFAARAMEKYVALCQTLDRRNLVPTHVYSFWFYDTALVASWISRRYLCARAVARAHRYDLYSDRTCLHYLPFRRHLLDSLDMVLACSKDGAAYINAMWPGFEEKVSTLYLGTRYLPNKSGEKCDDSLSLVSCSRVVDVKRVNLIAEAIIILEWHGISVSWTHFGDGPLMGDLKSICEKFTSSRVDLRGNLPNAELLSAYDAEHFDLFVNVSSSEGLPLSIMEACGFGIPVLATDVGGTHEIIEHGVNGFLLPERCTADSVAASIEAFAALDDDVKAEMRNAARNAWARDFQTEKNVKELARVLGVAVKELDD